MYCVTCRYWLHKKDASEGVCFRFPPTVMRLIVKGKIQTSYPRPMTKSDDFCGEHKQVKEYDRREITEESS